MDPLEKLPDKFILNVLQWFSFREKVRLETVSKKWRQQLFKSYNEGQRQIWIYTIFRKGRESGHDRMSVKLSDCKTKFCFNRN